MKLAGLILSIATTSLVSPMACAADEVPSGRRYLNQVFKEHIRTPNIIYAVRVNDSTGKSEKLTLRVFEPKGDTQTQRPLVLITPGGGFVQHDDHWMDDFGEQLARAGYVVAVNRYRLSTDVNSSEKFLNALFKAFSDQKAAIRYFVKDAQAKNRFRIDPDNIFVGGHSAGAIASMYVAYLDPNDDVPDPMAKAMTKHGGIDGVSEGEAVAFRIRGVINMSGLVTDLSMFDKSEPALMSMHGDKDDVVAIGTTDGGTHGSIPIHERADSIGLVNELHIIRGAAHNDPASTQLCPECLPLTKRFMFNTMREKSEKAQ